MGPGVNTKDPLGRRWRVFAERAIDFLLFFESKIVLLFRTF
jgi:hypothetical protein